MNNTTLVSHIQGCYKRQRGTELDATQAKAILETLRSISLADGRHGSVTEADIVEYFQPETPCES